MPAPATSASNRRTTVPGAARSSCRQYQPWIFPTPGLRFMA